MTSRMESVPASSATIRSQPNGDAAVRRRAELEGVEQEAELLLRLVLVEAHHREHALLDVLAVDTDRPAADLVAVADDVVGVGQRAAGVGVEGVEESGLGLVKAWCTAVQAPAPTATSPLATASELGSKSGASTTQVKREGRVVDQATAATDLEARGAEQRAAALGRSGGEEDAVARLGPDVGGEARRARRR